MAAMMDFSKRTGGTNMVRFLRQVWIDTWEVSTMYLKVEAAKTFMG
jgi:hypothetical protein